MHSNITLDRIRSQMAANEPSVQRAFEAIKQVTLSPPISLEELRSVLMSELCPSETVVSVPVENKPTIEDLHFGNIYDFTEWYRNNRSGFNEKQQEALDSVMKTRDMVESGCPCKRPSREAIAHGYFANFWMNNKGTDLLETISKISGAKVVTIKPFCSYPSG